MYFLNFSKKSVLLSPSSGKFSKESVSFIPFSNHIQQCTQCLVYVLQTCLSLSNGEASEVWGRCGSCTHQRESLALGVTFEASSASASLIYASSLSKSLGINISLGHP